MRSINRWTSWTLILSVASVTLGLGSARLARGEKKSPPEHSLVKPFDVPTLEDIDAKAQWEDLPVLDGMKLLIEQLKQEEPKVSVSEALQMANDSDEANEAILSALGRLPENDSEVNYNETIARCIRGEVKSTNPIMQSSVQEFDVVGLIGFGLFSFDWNMRPFASADSVKSWQTSHDRLMDKVVLRDDLVWSDGTPITAHDVVFSFFTIMNEEVPVPAVRSGTDDLRWVEAYDDHTLVFFHKESTAVNAWNVNFPIIPRHIYEPLLDEDPTLQKHPDCVALEDNPVVGGAYKIAQRNRGQDIVLERRTDWYMHKGKQVRDKPYFKTIRFRIVEDPNTQLQAIKASEVDDLELTPEHWQSQTSGPDFTDSNVKARGVEWTHFQFTWNCNSAFFGDARVRKAMSYAMNYDELIDNVCYGLYERCNGIYHPDSWMYPKKDLPFFEQDVDKAVELLTEAGWQDTDNDGILDKEIDGRSVKFDFTLFCANNDLRIKICTLLKLELKEIGIECTVRPLEFTSLIDKLQKHEFEGAFGGWGTGTDPYTTENIFKTGEFRNYGSYSNSEVDELFAKGKLEFDQEKRAEIYGRIHEILYEDQPCTWLYYQSGFFGFNKKLRGYRFSPRGPYHYSPGFSSIWGAQK